MAVLHSTHPETPEPVHSSFAQVLHANGPDTAHATELALYSWLVGRWDMDVTTFLEDGTTHRGRGEIHAGWVLQGRAIQDVWMIPRLRDRQPGIEPLPGAGNWYGTTLRIYDPTPSVKSRRIRFTGPLSALQTTGTGDAKWTSARVACSVRGRSIDVIALPPSLKSPDHDCESGPSDERPIARGNPFCCSDRLSALSSPTTCPGFGRLRSDPPGGGLLCDLRRLPGRLAGHRVHSRTAPPVRRPLRHLVAYGSTNKYRPVNMSKASGSSGE
jgi:hypothetical protein